MSMKLMPASMALRMILILSFSFFCRPMWWPPRPISDTSSGRTEKIYFSRVSEDREGNLWAGSSSGLDRLRDSPFVLLGEDRAISTGNHEIAPIALALDYARPPDGDDADLARRAD